MLFVCEKSQLIDEMNHNLKLIMIMHNVTTYMKYTMKQDLQRRFGHVICFFKFQPFCLFSPVPKDVLHLPFLIIANDKPKSVLSMK